MKNFDNEFAIYSWLRNKNTVEFLGVWEQLHNESFKGNEFVRFKNEAGANSFNLTPKKWIRATVKTKLDNFFENKQNEAQKPTFY